ncbi:MAG: YHYH protein [bacterium]
MDHPACSRRAAEPTALPLLGQAGFTVNGLPFYGPNGRPSRPREAVRRSVFNGITDECRGLHVTPRMPLPRARRALPHPAGLVAEPWRQPEVAGDHASPIIGFALDGFPIYGRFEYRPVLPADPGGPERLGAGG